MIGDDRVIGDTRKLTARLPLPVVALTVALALLLAWPAWTAVRNGLSDVYARPAIRYLEQERFDPNQLSMAEWQAIEASVLQADRLMPGNPQYLEALGLLNQLQFSFFADLDNAELDFHAAAAQRYFSEAAKHRPTWPYYWGNLALEQHRLGNFASDEFSLALANASRFGPWKNDLQRLVMDLGSETWEVLSVSARREFVLNAERGLHRQPQNTIRILQDYGVWPSVCATSDAQSEYSLRHVQMLCARGGFAQSRDAVLNRLTEFPDLL